ncbi:MAG: hypothetical protein LUD03_06770 [Firmicutes bacterium]|nr:hypothetical protein [Bacillota bacterium]
MGKSVKNKKFKVPKPNNNAAVSSKWTLAVLIMSFIFSVCFTAITSILMTDLSVLYAFFVLFGIIILNVIFDMVGTAVLSAEEYPFHSLCARRVSGAKESVGIIRHAPHVASVCCDVIGDIAGIVSGATTALIVAELVSVFGVSSLIPNLLLSGTVASLTIGGKAFFKGFAMQNGNAIVFFLGRAAHMLSFRKKRKPAKSGTKAKNRE